MFARIHPSFASFIGGAGELDVAVVDVSFSLISSTTSGSSITSGSTSGSSISNCAPSSNSTGPGSANSISGNACPIKAAICGCGLLRRDANEIGKTPTLSKSNTPASRQNSKVSQLNDDR